MKVTKEGKYDEFCICLTVNGISNRACVSLYF